MLDGCSATLFQITFLLQPSPKVFYSLAMVLLARTVRGMLIALCVFALGGCVGSQSQLDEQKEPHFLTGKSRVNMMDYPGAIEAFEKALEVNPHSASAHFEVALLYEKNQQDYAAAIYHFQRFLTLRPKSEYAEIVNQRILACKQELAKSVSLLPSTPGFQREYERLTEENKRLHTEIEQWRAYAQQLQTLTNQVAAAPVIRTPTPTAPQPALQTAGTTSAQSATGAAMSNRTHTVKAGETPTIIARKYGVKLEALMAANPRLDPRRMQVGQTLALPAQ